jgi:hypothetical protein
MPKGGLSGARLILYSMSGVGALVGIPIWIRILASIGVRSIGIHVSFVTICGVVGFLLLRGAFLNLSQLLSSEPD